MKSRNKDEINTLINYLRREKVNFPKLSKWAAIKPDTLKRQLISIANTWHEGNINAAALALESDMGH